MVSNQQFHTSKSQRADGRLAYVAPKMVALGSLAVVTRMMAAGPYADAMLGLMGMQ